MSGLSVAGNARVADRFGKTITQKVSLMLLRELISEMH